MTYVDQFAQLAHPVDLAAEVDRYKVLLLEQHKEAKALRADNERLRAALAALTVAGR